MSEVISPASAARAASESLEFAKYRLSHFRKQKQSDAIDEAELWQQARELVEARRVEEQQRVVYVQALHALSKRWGGARWWKLRDLFVAYTGWHPGGCDIDVMNYCQDLHLHIAGLIVVERPLNVTKRISCVMFSCFAVSGLRGAVSPNSLLKSLVVYVSPIKFVS